MASKSGWTMVLVDGPRTPNFRRQPSASVMLQPSQRNDAAVATALSRDLHVRGLHRLETGNYAGIDLLSGQILQGWIELMASPVLRQEIENGGFVTAPGVFELISALIADRMGFKALYVTGYGTVASALGLPDAGIATYTEMIERIGRIAQMAK